MTASRTRANASRARQSPATRALCAFAAAMARGEERPAAAALRRARNLRATRREASECALMLMLYAGYPSALEGLRLLNRVWPGEAAATREGSRETWRRRGEALCRRVYGPAYARLLPAVRALHPDLAVWMVEQGYGRVLARPGLAVLDRELITVAALAALGWERQLVSHVLGAARVGATAAAVRAALASGSRHAPRSARGMISRTWRRAAPLLAKTDRSAAGAAR